MAAFELNPFFNDWSYHIFYMFLESSRAYLLSVFQAVTISPRNSCWKNIKVKSLRAIGLYIFVCLVFYIMVNAIFPNVCIPKI